MEKAWKTAVINTGFLKNSVLLVVMAFAVFLLMPKESLSSNVRVGASTESSGLLLDYISSSTEAAGKVEGRELEAYIIGDC